MNSYETLYIVKPDMEEEARAALIQKFSDLVANNGGEVENVDEWGARKLAYAIDYITEGYYVLMNMEAKPEFPAELERVMKITDGVLRCLTTAVEE